MKLGGGGSTKAATNSLIEEQLQLQEATRLGILVTDGQVEDAFQQVARNVKMSTSKLNEVLRANGVSEATMKARLKAALAWQKVAEVAIKARVQISDLQLDQEAAAALDTDSSYDYILKEVLFITTGKGSAASRTGQANQYRKSFTGCDSAVQLSLSYTDAAVRDMGRRHATQLPDALAQELAKLNVGGITKPRVTESGVSMLAICSKTAARDTTFVKNKLRNEQGTEAMKGEAEKYLAELRNKAQIVYR
jgi:peptidyl-prolyl cis-trans isomerase SurA